MPAHWLLLTYFGYTLEYLWSASDYLLMTSDARRCALMSADDTIAILFASGDIGKAQRITEPG